MEGVCGGGGGGWGGGGDWVVPYFQMLCSDAVFRHRRITKQNIFFAIIVANENGSLIPH